MSVLAIDTSSALSSVALVADGATLVSVEHRDPRRHAEAIGPLLAQVRPAVDPSSLDVIACGVGPGPYTGLRVGIAAALALGAVWEVPVVGVCSLDAVAAAARSLAPDMHAFGVALDARRREVYWSAYDETGARVAGPRVGPADAIDDALRSLAWVGSGAVAYADVLGSVLADDATAYPQAVWVATVAAAARSAGGSAGAGELHLDAHGTDSGATEDAVRGRVLLPPRPLYLRRPDVTVSGRAA